MQQPAAFASAVDGDPGMAPGVARQRDHQYLRRKPLQRSNPLEAEPGLAVRAAIPPPIFYFVELARPVAVARDEAALRPGRGLKFRRHDVDLGLRKILQPAGMIEVEVGEQD